MNKLSLLFLLNILYPPLSFSMEKISSIENLQTTFQWIRYKNPIRGEKRKIGPVLNLPLIKETTDPDLIRFLQAEILNFTVGLPQHQFDSFSLETYLELNNIKSDGLRNQILNLGNKIPANPFVIHAQIKLNHLDRPEERRNLINTITHLPEEQRFVLIPQIQAYIIDINPAHFDPPSLETQIRAENCNPYPQIQELLYQLGQAGDDRALKIVIPAQHIIKEHYLEKPAATAFPLIINTHNDFIYNTENRKTVFSGKGKDLIPMIYDAVIKENPIARTETPDEKGVKKLYFYFGQKSFEVIMDPHEEYVKTAYPIFIYHDFNNGDLELKLEKLFKRKINKSTFMINTDTLVDLARKSIKKIDNIKYEFRDNGKSYLIIDIANQIIRENLKPKNIFIPNRGIYLNIPKNDFFFPRSAFPNLYEVKATAGPEKTKEEIREEFEKSFPALGKIKR
ncbi:TPA: hypothetical protein DIC20_05335 [Candidatus Dependentiae bacterium]|nr:MAG: hypothetical protein US03_C0010G0035 [candidate division TM6 bacterium GW2011_GWF2_36_131]KKQ02778.1 MAG: hypothetical protein US13_C0010G0040 [candidate division TM6 bacterium GW2011_GWE2_36_25]KKQ19124.1 MAG: hypothetical protein US32_C0015G0005 [candidate division TM6 bacterium GW2011_GWA2_36_9]HBR70129.1 hypothetical protein [Candidatus Dependentiae bacterium]HCU01089.1 hypothetical protein [Candidatus Dependentiae bacterium]